MRPAGRGGSGPAAVRFLPAGRGREDADGRQDFLGVVPAAEPAPPRVVCRCAAGLSQTLSTCSLPASGFASLVASGDSISTSLPVPAAYSGIPTA